MTTMTDRNRLAVAVMMTAFLFAPAPAGAHDLLRVSAGVANQWAWTDSLETLQSEEQMTVLDVRLGVGVWQALSVELGYRGLSSSGHTRGDSLTTDTGVDAIDLGVRYDLPLLTWLSVYGRAGGTYARGALTIRSSGARLEASDWEPGLYAAVGVDVRFPRTWFGGVDDAEGGSGFTVGLQFDIGYAWLASFAMSADAAQDGYGVSHDLEPMRSSAVDLGELSIQGLTYQLGIALHY